MQLFFSYFKELVGKEVIVELKNDLAISGILHSVDQYLNIKLENTRVMDEAKYPHMVSLASYNSSLSWKSFRCILSGFLFRRNVVDEDRAYSLISGSARGDHKRFCNG